MKWIFLSLALANLVYLGYNLAERAAEELPAVTGRHVEAGPALKLLSERTRRSARDIEVAEVLENPIKLIDQAGAQKNCSGLGPFEDVVSAQNVAERLNTGGFSVEMRAVDVSAEGADYRVVIPPLPSLQEAFRRLRELKSRGIDSYVISEGSDAQGISLGVFSSIDAAESQKSRLTAEGYETEIRKMGRVVRGYWLYGESGRLFPAALVTRVTAEFVGVNVTETACMN